MPSAWTLAPGALTTREELASVWGGSKHSGGIVPAKASSTVFLFSDPDEGEKYGYGWDGVSPEGDAYYYTGAGQSGDQDLKDRNGSVLHHESVGRTLRLFVAEGVVSGSQTKRQRYVGEFRVDSNEPYWFEPGVTKSGHARAVVVFRLIPIGKSDLAGLAESGEFASDPESGPLSVQMPLEVDSTFFYETSGSAPGSSEKRENQLVADFVAWTGGQPDRFRRWAIRVPGERTRLLTDIFDATLKVLYEAKGSSGRRHVRLALGQVLDYRRYVPQAKSCALLLPSRPSDEILSLLSEYNVGCVWRTPYGFESASA